MSGLFCSIGRLLRAMAESDPKPNTDEFNAKEALTAGEMVSKRTLDKLIETQLAQLTDKVGIIIDGYPRDVDQASSFESKVSFTIDHRRVNPYRFFS